MFPFDDVNMEKCYDKDFKYSKSFPSDSSSDQEIITEKIDT